VALDLSRFSAAFFEEALEHLSSMEALLLELDIEQPDAEALNGIFRAAHSVKGGAGIFGFQSLADLTHVLESLLDRMRKGTLAPSKRLVDLVLSTCDVMRAHVLALKSGGSADEAAAALSRQTLEAFENQPESEDAGAAPGATADGAGRFRVRIALSAEAFAEPGALDKLLADVRGAGKVTVIETGAKDGFKTPLTFDIETDAELDELRDSLEFLVPAESIEIGPATGSPVAAQPAAPAPQETVPQASAPVPAEQPQVAQQAGAPAAGDDAYGFFGPLPTKKKKRAPAAERPAAERRSGIDRRAEAEGGLGLLESSSIRINVAKVDQLVNLVGELVIAQSMVSQAARALGDADATRLLHELTQLERNTRDMQEAVMSIRMLPISFVFNRYPRMVRDLAERLGKKVRLETHGEETELDKGLIERIADPLTHLVRNAFDHGIEAPAERARNGKPEEGLLLLSAAHQGSSIVISVTDDGVGLDRDKIIAKARELGMPADESMTDAEVYQIIFAPGFSTAREVTDVSGRGVGMDVVRRNVTALGGRIEIESTLGQGTSIRVRLPLTLAIIDSMSVRVQGETYIVPLGHIAESLQPSEGQIKTVGGREVISVRGEYLPVVSLAEFLGLPKATASEMNGVLVVLETERGRAALRVDELLGQHQVVLKSLEANFRKVRGISGATIMGDGRVAFILDIAEIVGASDAAEAVSIAPEG
jgi:two-component system chemotaxis sensor kinase CheA